MTKELKFLLCSSLCIKLIFPKPAYWWIHGPICFASLVDNCSGLSNSKCLFISNFCVIWPIWRRFGLRTNQKGQKLLRNHSLSSFEDFKVSFQINRHGGNYSNRNEWKTLPARDLMIVCITVCNTSTVTADSGTVTTPNYPNPYDNNLQCNFTISTNANKVLLVLNCLVSSIIENIPQ